MFSRLVRKNRSYRRFREDQKIPAGTLKGLINLARLCPSGGNKQPLKYTFSNEREKNAGIFRTLAWAAYLKSWGGPAEGERPPAYIIILGDKSVSSSFGHDAGIAAQTILLGAAEKGLGGCMVGSVNRKELARFLKMPGNMEIVLVIALGKPAEKVVLEEAGRNGSTKYWRDRDSVHHVPKRRLEDIII